MTSSSVETGNVEAGRDFVGRDQHHDQRHQSGGAQVYVALTDRERQDWIIDQIATISTNVTQFGEKLKKLDQIDEALVGNRLRGERGLVEDVRRLWAVVIGIVVVLALIGVIEVAQWILLLRLLSAWPN
ncbi:MAG: hypothetical protein E6Q97_14260 [Desulfurellales bacterium]|nr:MAG: hypothetical protein E6Q97_14260 [Desulfurellales bacterium]